MHFNSGKTLFPVSWASNGLTNEVEFEIRRTFTSLSQLRVTPPHLINCCPETPAVSYLVCLLHYLTFKKKIY